MGAGPGTKATDRTVQGVAKQMYKNSVKTVYGSKAGAVLSKPSSAFTKNMLPRAAKSMAIETTTSTAISVSGYLYSKAFERGYNKIKRGLK